jgi:hypothetical protein
MAINEHFDEYPEGLIHNVKKNIEEERGLKLVPNYHLYIYLDGQYGDKSPFAGNYAKEFPASITGGGKATRFRSKLSYEKNKIYIDEEKRYVVFLSPTYGGVNIFSGWIPYAKK